VVVGARDGLLVRHPEGIGVAIGIQSRGRADRVIGVEVVQTDIDALGKFAVPVGQTIDGRRRAAGHKASPVGILCIGVGAEVVIEGGILLKYDHHVLDARPLAKTVIAVVVARLRGSRHDARGKTCCDEPRQRFVARGRFFMSHVIDSLGCECCWYAD